MSFSIEQKKKYSLFWFRRDLRLQDNAGLFHALTENKDVLPLFIFDTAILDRLENKLDKRVDFIHQALTQLNTELHRAGTSLLVRTGTPLQVFESLCSEFLITSVYTNHDYEPLAIKRDCEVEEFLRNKSIRFRSFKDQVVFEKQEVVKDDGLPYTVFTPYSKKWKATLSEDHLRPFPSEQHLSSFVNWSPSRLPTLASIGFSETGIKFRVPQPDESVIEHYHETRDYPAIAGTSKLSVHLRFGTVSIRQLVKKARQLNEQWLNELIWREFYMMILFHFPHVAVSAFKKNYDRIPWINNPDDFERWCNGQTGYPIVDAGMRELNQTGFMHNRVRMITASFLVKHLLIDWRWGEAYFAEKLMDFDLSANNGGWQWAASSGCDAAPYFRVFNPSEQTKRFDPKLNYIRKWVPELDSLEYPLPVIDHKFARERVLATYKKALNSAS